jgi:hypothetical protein
LFASGVVTSTPIRFSIFHIVWQNDSTPMALNWPPNGGSDDIEEQGDKHSENPNMSRQCGLLEVSKPGGLFREFE